MANRGLADALHTSTDMRSRSSARGRRERGAAMVEAAVVAVFMVMVFACAWSALRFQAAKLHAMDEARSTAWALALKGCEGKSDALADIGETASEAGSGPLPSTKTADEFAEIGATSLARDSGQVDVTSKRTVTFPKLMGGQSHELSGRMTMRCNEPNPPENLLDLFKTAVGVANFKYSLF